MDIKKIALFAAGTLFGSAGFKLLSSKDAKKVYTQTTAAVLRMKDSTMETVSKVQEQAGDILADAKAINEARAVEAEAAVIEDAAEETTEAGLNIENMVNKSKKNMAYTMLDATGAVDKKLAEKLAAIPAVIRVRIL